MKKCLVILLISCVALQSLHSLLHASWHFVQYQYRMYTQEKLVTIAIPLNDFENGIANFIESDEIKWKNEMYDIVAKFTINGIMYATAVKDVVDENIAHQEKKHQEKNKSLSNYNIVLFCAEWPSAIFKNNFFYVKHKYAMYSASLKEKIYAIIIPPPNFG